MEELLSLAFSLLVHVHVHEIQINIIDLQTSLKMRAFPWFKKSMRKFISSKLFSNREKNLPDATQSN